MIFENNHQICSLSCLNFSVPFQCSLNDNILSMASQTLPKLFLSLHVLLVTMSFTGLKQKLVFLLLLKHTQLVTTWGSWIFSSLHRKISARCSHNASFFLFSFQLSCHLVKKAFCVSPLKCCTPPSHWALTTTLPFLFFYLLITNWNDFI